MRRVSGPLALPLLLLLSTTACVTSHPPKCPSQGRVWTEVTSKHFTVITDLDDADARAASTDYETELEELRAVAFPRPDRATRITIVLFRNDDERWTFRPAMTGAEYADRLQGDVERSPTIVLTYVPYATQHWFARQTFLHELTHRFVHETYGAVPVWLDEGLADYLSTMTVDDGTASLGQVPFGYRLTRGYTASVSELLAVPRAKFYGGHEVSVEGSNTRNRYYRSAWAFVHYLQNGSPQLQALFRACLRKLDAGETLRDAWQETLGTIPADTLEQGFTAYVTTTDRWTGLELPIHPAPPSPIERARALSDDEVHLLWARLSGKSLPATDPQSEEAQLAEAARVAPESPEVIFRQGCFALEKKRTAEALQRFARAYAMAPTEPRYALGMVEALATDERADATTVAPWLARLEATARTADELSMAARVEAAMGQDAKAVEHANAAIAADPGYQGAFAARAFVHFKATRYAEAIADQERAVALAAEQSAGPEATLRTYQRALDTKGTP